MHRAACSPFLPLLPPFLLSPPPLSFALPSPSPQHVLKSTSLSVCILVCAFPQPNPYPSHRPSRSAHSSKDDAAYPPSSTSSSDNSDRGSGSNHRSVPAPSSRLSLPSKSPLPPSSSRRVLAHVLARKERDTQQMQQLLKITFAKLDEESQRATDAERRATECLVRARSAIDARAQADADAAAARTELAMYKMQLEQAQREVSRAQELLDGLEARRHEAEEDAARARSVARKLQEERAIESAREEGKQQGWHEGLRRGMLLGRREAEDQLRSRRHEDDVDGRSRSGRRGLTDAESLGSASERSSPDDLRTRGPPPRCVPLPLFYLVYLIYTVDQEPQLDVLPRLCRWHRPRSAPHPSAVAPKSSTSPVHQQPDSTTAHLTYSHTTTSLSLRLRPQLHHDHDHDHARAWGHQLLRPRPVPARTRPVTIQRLRSFSPSQYLPLLHPQGHFHCIHLRVTAPYTTHLFVSPPTTGFLVPRTPPAMVVSPSFFPHHMSWQTPFAFQRVPTPSPQPQKMAVLQSFLLPHSFLLLQAPTTGAARITPTSHHPLRISVPLCEPRKLPGAATTCKCMLPPPRLPTWVLPPRLATMPPHLSHPLRRQTLVQPPMNVPTYLRSALPRLPPTTHAARRISPSLIFSLLLTSREIPPTSGLPLLRKTS